VNNLRLDNTSSIKRVTIHSTSTTGKITLSAARDGLGAAMIQGESKAIKTTGCLTRLNKM
jgi:hypothetical protein